MKVLADTSVWIAHLRRSDPELVTLLRDARVLGHSAVVGELACGNLHRRVEFLSALQALPAATEATPAELLAFVERFALHGRGLGWIDVSLLASARLCGARLWTRDVALARAAGELGASAGGLV
jgi:predicted nucleic acid-binding protein